MQTRYRAHPLLSGTLGTLGRLVLIVMLWGIAATASSDETPPTILVFGDSLSAGYGIPLERGWVALLQERLEAGGFAHRVVNASISGETTAGGLARLADALVEIDPAIVILELGGNDGLQGMPLDVVESNLGGMIRSARRSGAAVLLIGMRIPPNYGPYYANAFSAVYVSLSEREDVPVVEFLLDGVAAIPSMMQDDGVHPTVKGQPRMLENVWPVLLPLLDDA